MSASQVLNVGYGTHPLSATGRDLPEADRPGCVALSGRFGANNRAVHGQLRSVADRNCSPESARCNTVPQSTLFTCPMIDKLDASKS
jgi:hypothetical protein